MPISRALRAITLVLGMSRRGMASDLYRADGVRITHDPYAPGMAAKYGAPGKTDREGFDPYADSVGAGIYSGTVKRDGSGAVVIGRQYQNHNPRPGPVYSGGGYTPVSRAIAQFQAEVDAHSGNVNKTTLAKLLNDFPDLVNDVSTGGALPLHTCGMSQKNQFATAFLISRGADIEGLDTYGYTPLHRMASNNLAVGAKALLEAGADPQGQAGTGTRAGKPLKVAKSSRARDVISVLSSAAKRKSDAATQVTSIEIFSAGYAPVIGRYVARSGQDAVPKGFGDVCVKQGWDTASTWRKLNGGENLRWFAHEDKDNESYIYYNNADRHWWIDGPDGLGAYKAPGPSWALPCGQIRWQNLKKKAYEAGPVLAVHRGGGQAV